MADIVPQPRLLGGIGLERDCTVEQDEALVDLVATDGQLGRPPQPPDCALAELRELRVLT